MGLNVKGIDDHNEEDVDGEDEVVGVRALDIQAEDDEDNEEGAAGEITHSPHSCSTEGFGGAGGGVGGAEELKREDKDDEIGGGEVDGGRTGEATGDE